MDGMGMGNMDVIWYFIRLRKQQNDSSLVGEGQPHHHHSSHPKEEDVLAKSFPSALDKP